MAIVVVGAVFVDIKGFPEDLYNPTGRNAGRVEIVHGGVGRNVAEDIANVELRPRFVSLVDDTASGAEVLQKLKKHRVDTRFVLSEPDGMGLWLAVFDNSGDLAGSISRRPRMDALIPLLDEKGDEIFRDADSIVLEIDMDERIVKRVLRCAEKYGKKVFGVVSNMTIASVGTFYSGSTAPSATSRRRAFSSWTTSPAWSRRRWRRRSGGALPERRSPP